MEHMRSIYGQCSITLRILVFSISLVLCALLLVGAQNAHAVGLKENTIVTDSTIKLGDIFYGLSEQSDKVLGPSPRPGTDMVLNARTLMRIAIALDLPWRPSSTSDYVVLSRAATLIDQNKIEQSLKEALKEKGVEGRYNLRVSSGLPDIILPHNQPGSFEISKVSFNPKNNWFEADIVAPSKNNPIHRARMSGTVDRLSSIPVLRENLRKGTIIGKRDVEFMDIPSRSVNHDTITNLEELKGMTPRRILHAGEPIRTGEIEAPQIVGRGQLVTMVFENGALSLTAKGKALENGAKGDLIRVVNTASNRTLEALVTGQREVTVQP